MKKLFSTLLAGAMLLAMGLSLAACSSKWYSAEKHIARVRERAEARFLGEGSKYTDLEVYPLYNENDELKYMLIEFEPQGFIYVQINERERPWLSMYTMGRDVPDAFWRPYVFDRGSVQSVPDENGTLQICKDRRFLQDEDGEFYGFYVSHFKAANIGEERRYLLTLTLRTGESTSQTYYIPAVKREDGYFNLVSWKRIPFDCAMDFNADENPIEYPEINFIEKNFFDL